MTSLRHPCDIPQACTRDGRYVVTADRDRKITVHCYPNTYNTQTYCLGHTGYVQTRCAWC